MSSLSAAALLLRRLRTEAAIVVLLFLVVAATSFLFAAAPRMLNRVTDDAVRYAVSSANPVDRDIWLYADGTIQAGSDPGIGAVREYGQMREAQFSDTVEKLISDRFMGVTSVRMAVPQSIVVLSLRAQDGVPDASTLVEGAWPVDRGMPLKQIKVGQDPNAGADTPPAVFEIALAKQMADVIGAHVGDQLPLTLDASDTLIPKTVFQITPAVAQVVGIYEPADPSAEVWSNSGLLDPSYKQGPDGVEAIYATGLIAPEAYPRLTTALLPFHFAWHYPTGPSQIDADQVTQLQTDLQRLSVATAPKDQTYLKDLGSSVTLNNVTFTTGLPRVLDGLVAQQARSESVLSIAALGVLGLAGGAIAMLAILLVRRRRGSLLLARGRGATGALLLGTQLFEAVVITGLAALVGYLLAVVAVPARDAPLSVALSVIVAATATLLLVVATWPAARRPLIQLERDDPTVVRVAPRRLVLEMTVVLIALGGVFLLRQRGLTIGPVGDTVTFDPLLAAVPLLIGVAAGIIIMRFYPLPVRALGRLAARRRDFVPVVGLRTVARHPATANLPLLVLMLTAAFGAFASVVASSIDRGQVAASYIAVGADYRLEAIGIDGLPPTLHPETVPGVDAVATGAVDSTAALVQGSSHTTIDLDTVDAPNYATVTAGTAADPHWPAQFLARPTVTDVGTPDNPIPAILSTQTPAPFSGIRIGDTFTMTVDREPLIFRLVQRQDELPGHGNASSFAIVPLTWMSDAVAETSLFPTLMWVRGSDAAGPALDQMAATADKATRVVSRQAAYDALHGSPLGSAVANFFGIALVVSVLFMAVTLVGAVVMSAAGRTRDLAYLRTLGVSTRQAQALTAVEQTPPVMVTLIPGVLLGVAVALLVEPGLGLADFVGATGVPLYIDWPTMLIVVVTLAIVVIAAIAAGTWLSSRARLASALRIEDS